MSALSPMAVQAALAAARSAPAGDPWQLRSSLDQFADPGMALAAQGSGASPFQTAVAQINQRLNGPAVAPAAPMSALASLSSGAAAPAQAGPSAGGPASLSMLPSTPRTAPSTIASPANATGFIQAILGQLSRHEAPDALEDIAAQPQPFGEPTAGHVPAWMVPGATPVTAAPMGHADRILGGTSDVATPGPAAIEQLLAGAAASHGVDVNLLREVARQESGFDPHATSPVGAQGVMQLMPDTAKGLGVTDPYNAAQNIDGGARMLGELIRQYKGSVPLALAAYNAGPGAVAKYNGIPPYPETQKYVRSIMGALNRKGA